MPQFLVGAYLPDARFYVIVDAKDQEEAEQLASDKPLAHGEGDCNDQFWVCHGESFELEIESIVPCDEDGLELETEEKATG